MPPPSPIDVLSGRYRLLRRLGDAGATELYLGVTRTAPRTTVLVKRVPPTLAKNKPTVTRFLDEARTTARLRHDTIPAVLEVGEDGGTFVAVFEHHFGASVEELLEAERKRRGEVPVEVATAILASVLEALAFAHAAAGEDGAPLDLIHRDVSARNVQVGYAGEVKLGGFGLAKHQEQSEHTSFGVVRGQLAYVAPEQLVQGGLDLRVDLWAAGVLLYELLTGVRPFDRQGEFHILKAIREEAPRPASELRPKLPAALDALVQRALAKDREQRFASASEMLEALEAAAPRADARALASYVTTLFAERLGSHREAARSGRAELPAILAVSGGESTGAELEDEPLTDRSDIGPSPLRARPAVADETSEPALTPIADTDRRPALSVAERAMESTEDGPPPARASRARLAAAPPSPAEPELEPLKMPEAPPRVAVRQEPRPAPRPVEERPAPRSADSRARVAAAPAAAPSPRAEEKLVSRPDPVLPAPRPGRPRPRRRFRLVSERGINPVIYPLVMVVAALLAVGSVQARKRTTTIAVTPLAQNGESLSALDDGPVPAPPPAIPLAPPPKQPTAPPAPTAEVQLDPNDRAEHPLVPPSTPVGVDRHKGTLHVDAPRGSRIFVDGKVAGSSVTLPPGTHRLRVVLANGGVREESFKIEGGKTVRRSISGKVVPPQPNVSHWP